MRDVLGIIAAGVVACLTFGINMIFLVNVTTPMDSSERVGGLALTIFFFWSIAISIAAAIFTIRVVAQKERSCDICGELVANDVVDWMQRVDKDGEASLWVPTHVDCSTDNHRIP